MKSFSNTILGFTQSHSGTVPDFDGFVQNLPGAWEIEKLKKRVELIKIV